jgi:hypothetical protein
LEKIVKFYELSSLEMKIISRELFDGEKD